MENFEGIFELFGLSVRRLANGNKMRVVLECQEDIDIEKQLIEFRGDNVKAFLTQQTDDGDGVVIEDVYEIFAIGVRRLRNGDKLSLVLEQLYEKDKEIQLVKLRYDNVKLYIEKIEEDLFDKDHDDDTEIERIA